MELFATIFHEVAVLLDMTLILEKDLVYYLKYHAWKRRSEFLSETSVIEASSNYIPFIWHQTFIHKILAR